MTSVRWLLVSVSIIFSVWTPTIKSTVDHGLVKKYFVGLYNEALVRAMKEQGDGGGVRRSHRDNVPFIPYSQSGGHHYSPQSAWKGEPKHKHKHNTHYHKHRWDTNYLSRHLIIGLLKVMITSIHTSTNIKRNTPTRYVRSQGIPLPTYLNQF